MMTLDEVKRRVDEIRAQWDAGDGPDSETIHIGEDELAIEVFAAISGGSPDAVEMAKAMAELLSEEHSRWYA